MRLTSDYDSWQQCEKLNDGSAHQVEMPTRKDITYYEAENAKEIEQIEGSNRWIKELRDSLNKEN